MAFSWGDQPKARDIRNRSYEMPSNHKVYQKKTSEREKIFFLKFFFWPLCAISLAYISRLKFLFGTNIQSRTQHGCPIFESGCAYPHLLFFVQFAAEDRATWRRPERRSVADGRCRGLYSNSPLHSIEERKVYGTENVSQKENSPGSSKGQGNLQGQGAAEGMANQSRLKSQRQGGQGCETADSKAESKS